LIYYPTISSHIIFYSF